MIDMHSRKQSPFVSLPLSLSPSRLLTVLRVRQLAAATAQDHRHCLPPPRRPQALEKPSCTIRCKDGDARQEETSCIAPWARSPCIRWLSRWQRVVELHLPGVSRLSRLVVECQAANLCQGWKVVNWFPPCCQLQNYANTVSDTSKMQVAIEEEQGAQPN